MIDIKLFRNNINFNIGKILAYDEIGSTNDRLKSEYSELPDFSFCISDIQTKGKGRLDHSFFSDLGGAYFSFVFNPSKHDFDISYLTRMISVSIADILIKDYKIDARIKWVNDICINLKKVCGILVESVFQSGGKDPDCVVCGIGLNVKTPRNGFPDEIKKIVSVLDRYNTTIEREKIVAQIMNSIYNHIVSCDYKYIEEKYSEYSCVLGKDIVILNENGNIEAKALKIQKNGYLRVLCKETKKEKILNCEDISIKLNHD